MRLNKIMVIGIVLTSAGCELADDAREVVDDTRELAERTAHLYDELTTRKLDTHCMSPNHEYGTVYEIDHQNTSPSRFDIIEFTYEDEFFDPNDFWSDAWQISRVIGMPNESIHMVDGQVYINDTLLHQPFLVDSALSADHLEKQIIPEDAYFVMVDHRKMIRNDSFRSAAYKPYDSRIIGTIPSHKIEGVINLD